MRAVWKYEIDIEQADAVRLSMPAGARIIKVAEQHGRPVLWAEIDPEEGTFERRHFRIVGTGHLYSGGEFVGHLFEKVKPHSGGE